MQRRTLEWVVKSSALEGFYMAGGTALYIKYQHRPSEDFDFFTYPNFSLDIFILQRKLDKIPVRTEYLIVTKDTLVFLLEGVKFSFFEYTYPLLKPTSLNQTLSVELASDDDLACMKTIAIAQRGLKKDFYDLWFLMKKHAWSLNDIVNLVGQKYRNVDRRILLKSLIYFEDAEKESYPDIDPHWNEVKSYFIKNHQELIKRLS